MISENRYAAGIPVLIFLFIFLIPLNSFAASDTGKSNTLKISIQEAVLLALENNRAFQIERINPDIRKTFESEEMAAFDPIIKIENSHSKSTLASGIADLTKIKQSENSAEVTKKFSTGTELTAGVSTEYLGSSRTGSLDSARGAISLNQHILKGFGRGVNLASLRKSRLASLASEYELRGFAESLVADVEKTCWDYILAQKRIAIFQDSLKLAEDQLEETKKRIKIGKLAKVEVYAAQAEVALRKEALINAKSDLALIRLYLQRLINTPVRDPLESGIEITDKPIATEASIGNIKNHVQTAFRMRPEINQTKLEIQQDDIEIVRTKNGLLPVLDFFITLGKTGYANSFGEAFRNMDSGQHDISAGLTFQFPIYNRAEKARYKRAVLYRQQEEEALKNLKQLVEMDVRSAMIEINRAREQISATASTRRLQEESLRAESEKFRVGKSTAILVARAQRDFVASQISEVEALITYFKVLIDLYQKEGTLLERKGISSPGEEPVKLSAMEIH